jgi:predicted nucleotidyltransferase component of viral defense system
VSAPTPSNLPASIKQRLLNLGKQTGEELNVLLTKYALERFLYRIGKSRFRHRFILKGAFLFIAWNPTLQRTTRDVDFLDMEKSSPQSLRDIFCEITKVETEPDGVRFTTESVRTRTIREDNLYGGVRVNLTAMLGKAKIPLQIDIGFGDAVVPPPQEIDFPVLLPSPMPRIKVYPQEAMIAEKFHAAAVLGMRNSRMKDYFDIYTLSQSFPFSGEKLSHAIISVFQRRRTALPHETPLGLSATFASGQTKNIQWRHFLTQAGTSIELSFSTVIAAIQDFLMPLVSAAVAGKKFNLFWPPGGPWEKKTD